MYISSTTPPAKRVRAKAKNDVAGPAPKHPRSRKQPASPATNVEVVAMQSDVDTLAHYMEIGRASCRERV